MQQRLFLKTGDQVVHRNYPRWGIGVVVEERTSVLAGGICMVRISFRDGVERCFINALDDYNCCYYAGIRLLENATLSGRAGRQSLLIQKPKLERRY